MHFNNLKLQLLQSLDKLFTNFTTKKKKISVPFTSSGTLNHVRIDEKDKSVLNSEKSHVLLLYLRAASSCTGRLAGGDGFPGRVPAQREGDHVRTKAGGFRGLRESTCPFASGPRLETPFQRNPQGQTDQERGAARDDSRYVLGEGGGGCSDADPAALESHPHARRPGRSRVRGRPLPVSSSHSPQPLDRPAL